MLITMIAACCGAAAGALADGDPASDVLAAQPSFVPQDAGIGAPQQAQLLSLVSAAQRRGYPIRVAIVASAADLGSVSVLWRQPQTYARFLRQELSLLYHGSVLVVMPNGLGLAAPGGSQPARLSVVNGLAPGAVGPAMASDALEAVTRLAAAAGHPLPVPNAGATPSAGPASGSDAVPWVVFGVGLVAVALAWTASLRARPLRQGSGGSQAG